MCKGCKYYFEDMSCNDCDCEKINDMSEKEYDDFWVEEKEGCPYKEEGEENVYMSEL